MANNIAVAITADVADLTAKRAIMSAELKAATVDLNSFAKAAAAAGGSQQLGAGMLAAGESVARLKTQLRGLDADLKAAGTAADGAFGQLTVAAAGASGSLKEMRDVGLEVRESFRGLGEALIAAFAIHEIADFAKGMADTAEQTQHTAETFGLATEEVQRLRAEATGLGVPLDALVTAMQRVDRSLVTAREGSKQTKEAFAALGIDITKPISQAELLQKAIAGLANISDVPSRIGLAMQLFGRNIQNLGPIIGATKEQIAEIAAETTRYGAVNEQAQASGLALADAFNRQKVETLGLMNTLTAQLGPTLTRLVDDITGLMESFRQWASQGDNLKNALHGLTIVSVALASVLGAGALTAAVEGLISLLSGVFLGAVQLATAGMVEFDVAADANPIGALVLAIEALVAGLTALYLWLDKIGVITEIANAAAPAWDAVTAAVKLVGDAFRPLNELITAYQTTQAQLLSSAVVTWWNELAREVGRLGEVLSQVNGFVQRFNALDIGQTIGQWLAKQLGLNSAVTGLNTEISHALTGVGDFLKANFPGVVAAWDGWVKTLKGDIDALTGAWNRFIAAITGKGAGASGAGAGAAAGGALGGMFSPPQSVNAGAIPDLGGGGRGRRSGGGQDPIQQLMQQYQDQLQHTEDMVTAITGDANANMLQGEITFWSQKLAAAKQGSELWFAIIERLNPLVAQQQAEETREAKRGVEERLRLIGQESQAAIKGAQEQYKAVTAGLADEIAAVKAATAQGVISRREETNQIEALLRQQGKAAQDEALSEYLATAALLNEQISAEQDGSAKQQELIQKRLQAWVDYENKRAQINADTDKKILAQEASAAEQFKATWDRTITPIVQKFGDGLLQMAEGAKSLKQVMLGIGQQILSDWVRNISQMVSHWAMGVAAQVLATRTGENAKVAAQAQGSAQGMAISATASIKDIVNSAASAAAGAYKALAGIPVIGPELGAAAAAAIFAAAIAFRGMVSAAGGFDIPAGVNPMAQLHAQEMVLPARIANPMRAMLSDYGSGGGFGGVSGGHSFSFGDFVVNGGPSGMTAGDFRQALRDHATYVAEAVSEGLRAGFRPRYSQPFGVL